MSFGMIMKSVFEVALIGFTLWALLHEDRIAGFEQRLVARFRRRRLKIANTSVARDRYPVRGR